MPARSPPPTRGSCPAQLRHGTTDAPASSSWARLTVSCAHRHRSHHLTRVSLHLRLLTPRTHTHTTHLVYVIMFTLVYSCIMYNTRYKKNSHDEQDPPSLLKIRVLCLTSHVSLSLSLSRLFHCPRVLRLAHAAAAAAASAALAISLSLSTLQLCAAAQAPAPAERARPLPRPLPPIAPQHCSHSKNPVGSRHIAVIQP